MFSHGLPVASPIKQRPTQKSAAIAIFSFEFLLNLDPREASFPRPILNGVPYCNFGRRSHLGLAELLANGHGPCDF